MNVIDFCETPRTMAEVLDAGFTRDQIYNSVKNGKLVNLTRRDAWGRTTHNRPGLFQSEENRDGNLDGHNFIGHQRLGGQVQRFDAKPLVAAWGALS
jgi:hypothetical protein